MATFVLVHGAMHGGWCWKRVVPLLRAAGREVFMSAGCANCHTLSEANATGTVGPNLDDTDLDREEIEETVRNGRGGMPPFEGQLQDEQIEAVADFVFASAQT